MAFEKDWAVVSPKPFTADGNAFGMVTLANTAGFRVKQSAYLKNTAGTTLPVQVKRVLSSTTLVVGLIDNNIASWKPLDISTWTVASGASIGAEKQDKKANPSPDDHYRAIYEADPVVADRVIFVDQYGNFYDANNPLPIAFDGTITVGNVIVQDDDGNRLDINPDGSINVVINETGGQPATVISTFNEISSVAAAVSTILVSYTIPVGKTAALQKIDVAGENIARYDVFINSNPVDTKRTYFSGPINEVFDFRSYPFSGIPLVAGDVILVKVLHNRPNVGDFEGRIQIVQLG